MDRYRVTTRVPFLSLCLRSPKRGFFKLLFDKAQGDAVSEGLSAFVHGLHRSISSVSDVLYCVCLRLSGTGSSTCRVGVFNNKSFKATIFNLINLL